MKRAAGPAGPADPPAPRRKRRHEPERLRTLCLRAVGRLPDQIMRSPRQQEMLARICDGRGLARNAAALKLDILNSVVAQGRLGDDTFPPAMLDSSFRDLVFVGSKITRKFLTTLCQHCPHLQSLSLLECFYVDDDALKVVLSGLPGKQLRHIVVEGCRKVTDGGIQHMIEFGRQLQSISLGGCYNTSPEGIEGLIKNHPGRASFTSLHISGCRVDDGILQRVIEDCPNLTELSIGYSNVTAGVVEELLRRLPGMKKLQLHWSTCLTSALIAQLPQLCPNIEELNISGARGVPSTVIMEMVLMCCMPKSLQEQLLTGGGAASMPLPAGVGDDDADGMEEDDAAAGCGAGAAAGGGMAPPTPLRRLNVKFTEFTKHDVAVIHAHCPSLELIA